MRSPLPLLRSLTAARAPVTAFRKLPPARLFTTTIPRRNSPPAPETTTPRPWDGKPAAAAAAPAAEKPFYITTPIFYVNAAPHVGHLYTMVLTDVIKRWQELRGRKALLCTGTDEHGMKIQQAAAAAQRTPADFVNDGAEMFKSMAFQSNTAYDTFIRTSEKRHYDAVQYFWSLLEEQNYIYTGKHEGWYSVSDETFYPENSTKMTMDPKTGRAIRVSLESGRVVEWTSEINYHFRLSAMAPKLLEFYERNPNWVLPHSRMEEVVRTVKEGLEDLSVSRPRDRLTWGIPVPSDPTQTIYVWLDALVNYLTASGYPFVPGQESALGWPADLHVIGKDIVKFHCIYWPAFLLALDLPMPKQILSHAHWTMGKKKMSKTEGNVVNPFFAIQRFGVDAMRYYMLRDGGIQNDGDYSNEWIVERYKKELSGGYGNLANRVCGKAFSVENAVKDAQEGLNGAWTLDEHDDTLIEVLKTTAAETDAKMDAYNVPAAVRQIQALSVAANQYLHAVAPWSLKKPEEKPLQNRRIFLASEAVRICAILLQPFVPERAKALLEQMGVREERRGLEWAKFARDDAYGHGSNSKRWLPFPPLSE